MDLQYWTFYTINAMQILIWDNVYGFKKKNTKKLTKNCGFTCKLIGVADYREEECKNYQ
jgi:hypothetical protein